MLLLVAECNFTGKQFLQQTCSNKSSKIDYQWNIITTYFTKPHRLLSANLYTNSRTLARKLKVMTFPRNWEIRLVFTKGRHLGWRQEVFFVTTCRMLENATLVKKYFEAWHHATQTNHHWKNIFSLFIISLVVIWNINA